MKRYIIGIDPGKTGGMAVIDKTVESYPQAFANIPGAAPVKVFDFPVMGTVTKAKIRGRKTKTGKPVYRKTVDDSPNFRALAALVAPYAHKAIAYIEDVNSYGMGRQSAFNFGGNVGAWRGVLAAFGVDVVPVAPAVWKKDFLLSREKSESIALARKLCPSLEGELTKKKHDGRAEAILLAYWGYQGGLRAKAA